MTVRVTPAKKMALGGIMAALALTFMCLGGLIPIATYACPVLCMLLLSWLRVYLGGRIAWAWYGAVAILSLLIGPDKEAAAVFCAIGYYPVIQPKLDKMPLPWFWKFLLFNIAMILLYSFLIRILGMAQITQEFGELGRYGAVIMLALGNLIFFALDRVLRVRISGRRK